MKSGGAQVSTSCYLNPGLLYSAYHWREKEQYPPWARECVSVQVCVREREKDILLEGPLPLLLVLLYLLLGLLLGLLQPAVLALAGFAHLK